MIGQTISHYRISAELGRGGMGVVYRAHDERLLRSVAIKILSDASSGSAETRSRMLAEARAASSLHHPGITTIYEVGEDGDSIFLVMELVEGRTLRSMLSDGPLDPKRIIEIGAQLAEALDAAHSRGVFHGDVKPENIVVQADGRAKLLDFGVARHGVEDTITKTLSSPLEANMTPGIQGTIAYLAPEQLRCEAADGRADLFSLGVVLYELSSGCRPFTAPNIAALISQVISGEPPHLRDAVPGAPAALCSIVGKLLEKEAARRYQSARDLQRELTSVSRDLELGTFLPAALAGMAMSTYTGALLSATTSTPLWAAAPRRIAAAFGASAMASGAAALTIAERGREAPDIGPALDRIALVASAVELFLLLSLRQRLREQGVDGALDETGGASPTILVQWHSAPACRYCIILKACSNPSVRRGAHGRSRSPFSPAGSCCATCCCAPATPRQSGPRTIFI